MSTRQRKETIDCNASHEVMIDYFLNNLCKTPRYSGSEEEKKAAQFIKKQFIRFGLKARQEKYKFPNWNYSFSDVKLTVAGKTRSIQSIPMGYSASTPDEGITAPLIYLGGAAKKDLEGVDFNGKIGLVMGDLHGCPATPDILIRLNNSGLRAILVFSPEFPYSWPVSLNFPTEWKDYIKLPLACLPYLAVYPLLKKNLETAKIKIKAKSFNDISANIIGEVKGRIDETIVVCGHYDTPHLCPGANDNGSGTAFVMELARVFGKTRPYRTLRFIALGGEEKRSIGAWRHITQKSNHLEKVVFAINADTLGSIVGRNIIHLTGHPQLRKFIRDLARENNFTTEIPKEISPWWTDHFSFNLCGVPSIWFHRPNCLKGYWEVHSIHDNLENISPAAIARAVGLSVKIIDATANSRTMPFPKGIPANQKKKIQLSARHLRIGPLS